jgi:hypothetical protein
MNSAMYFLPFANSAAQAGAAVAQSITEGIASSTTAFAEMLSKPTEEEDKEKKIDEGLQGGNAADSMIALIDQIQSGLQAKLQSMGLQFDGEMTLSIDAEGNVSIEGDSDAAAVLEQLINSDPKLQAKMGALKRACEAAGQSAVADTTLKYFAGQLQLETPEPSVADELAADDASAASAVAA